MVEGASNYLQENLMSQMFPFGQLPPEVQEELQRRHELAHMASADAQHQLLSFFDGLTSDQLKFLHRILVGCENSNEMVSYYEGLINSWMHFKHGLCFCGEKHGDTSTLAPVGDPIDLPEPRPKLPPEGFPVESLPVFYQPLLDEYNMEVAPIVGNPEKMHLRCKGCETPYVSMQDRMRRPPGVEGCSTCQQKAKWG